MNRRRLTALAALAVVPAGILTSAAVTSSANPLASAMHSVTEARLLDANSYAAGGSGGGNKVVWCTVTYYNPDGTPAGTISFQSTPPCPHQ
jgi:hypothetical protein